LETKRKRMSQNTNGSAPVASVQVQAPPPPPAPKCPIAHAFPVLVSCFVMAAVAGFVNAFFMESIFATTVSHLTGLTTRSASQFAAGKYDLMLKNLGVILFFFLGSMTNSLIVGDSPMRMVQNYGFAIMLEAALLLLPIFIPTDTKLNMNVSIYSAAFAMGLQNAMLTIYGTAIVRTTHVTGLVTDVGILTGLWIRDLVVLRKRRTEGMWKIKIMVPLYLGFFTGAALGMLAMTRIEGAFALIIPSVVTAWVGIGFLILRYIHNKQEAAKQAAELQMKREIERKESLAKIEKKESLAKIEKKGKKGDKAGLLASSDDLHEEDEEIGMQNRKN